MDSRPPGIVQDQTLEQFGKHSQAGEIPATFRLKPRRSRDREEASRGRRQAERRLHTQRRAWRAVAARFLSALAHLYMLNRCRALERSSYSLPLPGADGEAFFVPSSPVLEFLS